ncbi:MAG: VOC family protein [Gallionellaceae bacterium]
MNIHTLLHATLLVDDLQKARGFYEQILGLNVSTKRPPMSFDGVWYELGMQQLHLMQLPSPEAGLQRPQNGGRDRHLAFAVDDLTTLAGRLHGSGVAFNMSQSGRRALFCRDPDDNALEFIEQS